MEKLIERLRMAQIASCSCLTKTAVIEYHTEDCLYRILEEAARAIEQASQHKAICDCGDSIEPDTGAVCGTCASIEQASQPQVPEGYRLVPEVATWDMIIAATETELTDYSVSPDDETRMTTIGECSAVSIYDAMLEAAPAAPKNAV